MRNENGLTAKYTHQTSDIRKTQIIAINHSVRSFGGKSPGKQMIVVRKAMASFTKNMAALFMRR